MTINPGIISNLILILTAWGSAFLIVLWLSLVTWAYRDIKTRSKDNFIRILTVAVVALLFLPGILIYLIIRPKYTIEEEYQRSLEEEVLLQSLEERPRCPGCNMVVKDDWQVCPSCHTKIRKTCHRCGSLMELSWNLCPFCTTPAPGMQKENLTLDEALRPPPGTGIVDEEPDYDNLLGDY